MSDARRDDDGVTQEMVYAGVDAYNDITTYRDDEGVDSFELVRQVYIAMEAARREPSPQESPTRSST